MNPKAEIIDTLIALKSIQQFLYPHGISEEFAGVKKADTKDEEIEQSMSS